MNTATAHDDRNDVAGATGLLAEQLTIDVYDHLHQLRTLAPFVEALTQASGPPFFNFLTHDAREHLDRAVRMDRHIASTNAQLGHPAPTAPIPTPGNLAGISADAEIAFLLQDTAKTLNQAVRPDAAEFVRHLRALNPISDNPSLTDQIARVDDLIPHVTDVTALKRTAGNLAQAVKVADELVDGPSENGYHDPCPICGRRSLVVHFRDDLIRCEAKPAPSRCRCTTGNCPCHRDPDYRHEWHRVRGNGWYALKSAIDHRKKTDAATTATTPEKEPPAS